MLAFKGVSVLLIVAGLQFLSTYGDANPIGVNPKEDAVAEDIPDDDDNYWEKSGYFEGDIILDERYFRNGRLSAIDGKPLRFKSTTISVAIAPEVDAGQREMIQKAFAEYHARTCIRFKEYDGKNKAEDYIYIKTNDKGCHSHVGRLGGRQDVNLENSRPGTGCFRHGTIVHELLHALGFHHQHSTTDRDDHVTILWENIQKGKEHNFQKYSKAFTTTFGISYDYGSILHYSGRAFSSNGKETIVPKQAGAQIGQRVSLSQKDIQKLHLMYGCPAPGGYDSGVDADTDLEELLTDSELLD